MDSVRDLQPHITSALSNTLHWWNSCTYGSPSGDLVIVPDARNVRVPARLRGDEGPLRDNERARVTRALSVVLGHEGRRDVLLGGTVARERGHYDAVLQCHVADLDGCEELWLRHGCE